MLQNYNNVNNITHNEDYVTLHLDSEKLKEQNTKDLQIEKERKTL